MLFNAPQFILAFLPASIFGYFFLNRLKLVLAAKLWLVLCNLFFYGFWSPVYLPLLLASMLINYLIGAGLARKNEGITFPRRLQLVCGIGLNLCTLGYFKYTDFFLGNFNAIAGTDYPLPNIILPLAISFFTFQQIAFLVDSYRRKTKDLDTINYMIFVSFFPQLIAGPIVHHSEMMPQFQSLRNAHPKAQNIAAGLFIFSIGFFKKVIIADTFAVWATAGFDGGQVLDFWGAWATSLSYTFQLYFDFSGYCDMAIGAALMFNIRLPLNFDSPYKAFNIQDFWRRWHMTLGRFLRDYLFIPLGGSRVPEVQVYANVIITFVLGGLWHGASWMFVIWGALHGVALASHRLWRLVGLQMPAPLAWTTTFLFVVVGWVFFRASTLEDAMRVLSGMIDASTIFNNTTADFSVANLSWGGVLIDRLLVWLPVGMTIYLMQFFAIGSAFVIISQRNGVALMNEGVSHFRMAYAGLLFSIALYASITTKSSVFLYFNF